MNPVRIRHITIGEGIPKICVPIVGVTKDEILQEAKSFDAIPADLAEWRVDWFANAFDKRNVLEILASLRKLLGERPILFTFRTQKEGGEQSIEPEDYVSLNEDAAMSGFVDLIDAEIFSGDDIVKKIIETSHQAGVKVIASNHDFHGTPEKKEILQRLYKMQDLGADISKIAVMPQTPKDVLTLLAATEEMQRSSAKSPIVTMSMAGTGVISRLCGEIFGSAITFGAADRTSAPGQIKAAELAQILSLLHHNLQ